MLTGTRRRQKVVRTKRRRAAAIVRPLSAAAGARPAAAAAAARSNDADPCKNARAGIRLVNADVTIHAAASRNSTTKCTEGDESDHFNDSSEDESVGSTGGGSTSIQKRMERPLSDVAVAIRLRSRRLQQEEMERQMQQHTERLRQRMRQRGMELVAAARHRSEAFASVVTESSSDEGTAGAAYGDEVGLAARGRARAVPVRRGCVTPRSETNESSSEEREDDDPIAAPERSISGDAGIDDPASDAQTMLCPVLSGKKRRQHQSDTASSLRLSVRRREHSWGVDGTANAATTPGGTGPPWSEVEEALLLEAIRTHGFRWPDVSAYVGTRTASQCKSHNQHLQDRYLQV